MSRSGTVDIVVVDDEKEMALALRDLLQAEGFRADATTDPHEALLRVREGKVRVILSDVNMPGMNGMDLVRETRRVDNSVPVLLVTAFATMDAAMEAVRAGAYHYLTKPVQIDDLLLWVRRALEEVRLRSELAGLKGADESLNSLNPAMQKVLGQVPRLAQLSSTVLVTGESGTGKERVSRALHFLSHRAEMPFVPLNCGAIPENLIESELFGHEEGAFTGAVRTQEGLLQVAGEGTLFLDEIGELPLLMQTKLLRVLQEGRFRRIGSRKELELKARVVVATNRDLAEEVRSGRFREDLYYRLKVIPIHLPPLRERMEDLIPLANRILDRHCQRAGIPGRRLSKEAQVLLLAYRWPGNIRELGNAMERAMAFSDRDILQPEDFAFLKEESASLAGEDPLESDWPTLEELERRYVEKVLSRTGGHRSRACEILGIDPKTLYRKLREG
ncbi:MAG TPA: sigma-54 dependent transcriptional regulator [Fibrobacteria bacterium]|nr:sigma-54 dependent transcriptional regulator [Fibrobacteria bacterium]HOX51436.1 sigma-54 dependent transcriptional regulator [Fibrobacteria bacterium]